MKYLIFVFIVLITISYGFGQRKNQKKKHDDAATWFFLSGGGTFGNGVLMNDHVSNQDIGMGFFNPSFGGDICLGANFPFGAGIVAGLDFNTLTQSYEYNSVSTDINLGYSGKYILLRGISANGGYFEAGPRFCKVTNEPGYTQHNDYRNNFTSLILGFGGNVYWHQNFDISAGLRLGFNFNHMETDNYPFGGIFDTTTLSSYEKTSSFTAQLRIALSWHIGYFRKAQCDKHIEFLFF
ncbi:MAG: hypothetical protein ABIJ16_10885 [Bacteroidota bacterium]